MTPVSHRRFKKVVSRRTKMRGQVVGKNTTLVIICRTRAKNKRLCVILTNCANVPRMGTQKPLRRSKNFAPREVGRSTNLNHAAEFSARCAPRRRNSWKSFRSGFGPSTWGRTSARKGCVKRRANRQVSDAITRQDPDRRSSSSSAKGRAPRR